MNGFADGIGNAFVERYRLAAYLADESGESLIAHRRDFLLENTTENMN